MKTPRHTAAGIRRLPQQISIVCEKMIDDEYETTTLRGIITPGKSYLKSLRYNESNIEGQLSTVELCERRLFKQISSR